MSPITQDLEKEFTCKEVMLNRDSFTKIVT